MTHETGFQRPRKPSRREFLKTSAAVTGAALGSMPLVAVHAQEAKRTFKIALIGCGGRGNQALENHMDAVKAVNEKLGWNVKAEVVATADWFPKRALAAGKRYGVPASKCFDGADCYRKAIEAGPDIVLMAQPPLFRPLHFEAAIRAGKHVFFEKPSAVDPPGVRRVIAAGAEAKAKGLTVVAGTQRRHEQGYNRRAREIKEGHYGKILGGRVAWNQGAIFTNTPINPKGPDDLAGPWQIWVEMSGDHICEQHVHNLDIANWFIGSHPVSAGGFGYRARRKAGNMYDFFSIDFEYPGNVHVHSMCRQIADCWEWTGEDFMFEKQPGKAGLQTPDPYEAVGYPISGYVAEHAHLLYAIVKEQPINEARAVAESTGTAILGRESAYTGQRITWDEMFKDPKASSTEEAVDSGTPRRGKAKPVTDRFYNLKMSPAAEDFETGNVRLLKDGDIRIPGV
jgi:myo-inositol 2-dehydrogenase / D-chiro-inositol 1-dehydrogenase